MTIRLGYAAPHRSLMNPRAITVPGNGAVLAYVDTDAEAEQAKRAFEQVLAPRFTRDEAIAIAKDAMEDSTTHLDGELIPGIRLALEALAAAGVFVDAPGEAEERECRACGGAGEMQSTVSSPCVRDRERVQPTKRRPTHDRPRF